MKYYKDAQNQVYAYEDGTDPKWISPGLTPISKAEADALRAPTAEQLAEQRRDEILSRLAQIDMDLIRPLDARDEGTATGYDTQKLADLRAEKRTLRAELAELEQAG
jgi:hypothetical protein